MLTTRPLDSDSSSNDPSPGRPPLNGKPGPRAAGTRPRRGRHRAPSRWSLYRSSHGDHEGNLVSLLIPAWRGDSQRPGDGRPPTIIDLTVTPTIPLPRASTKSASAPPLDSGLPTEAIVQARQQFVPTIKPPVIEIAHHSADWAPPAVAFQVITPPEAVAPPPSGPMFGPPPPATPGPLLGPPSPRIATPVILGPIVDLRGSRLTEPQQTRPVRPVPAGDDAPVSVVVDRSVVLPIGKEERGTFANMLGFGEDEAYYGPTASIRLDEPTARYELAAHAITAPVEATPTDWDNLPGLSDVAFDDTSDTGTLIGRLWDATADQPILEHVDVPLPKAPDRILLGAKRWRWSVMGGLAIAVVLVFVAGSAVGRQPIEAARQQAIEYTASAQRLASALAPIEQAATDITDLSGTEFDMGPIVASLDTIDGVARDVAETAAADLPSPALLGSSAEIDRLERPQHLLQQAASAASTIERRLGDALTYRLELDRAFELPELPVSVEPEQVADLGAEFSMAIATTETILAGLPNDAFFLSHHRAADEVLNALTERHVDYLDALRQGDPATAGIVRREMVVSIATLRESLDEPMMAMSTWAEDQLSGLRDLIRIIADTLG